MRVATETLYIPKCFCVVVVIDEKNQTNTSIGAHSAKKLAQFLQRVFPTTSFPEFPEEVYISVITRRINRHHVIWF